MTTLEFSSEFDILYNNIMSNTAPGLDEYEKSVFLTKAQNDLVIEWYSGRNLAGSSLEKTDEIRSYLRPLIKEYVENFNDSTISNVSIPEDLYFVMNEYCITPSDKEIMVIPIKYDEYNKILRNPFRKESFNKILRLDLAKEFSFKTSMQVKSYNLTYLRKPNPIVLSDFDNDINVDGISTVTECELMPITHHIILERAVVLAFRTQNITVGQVQSDNKN